MDAERDLLPEPKQVSDQARIFPQFETINPLGMTITEFHENRMGVEAQSPATANIRPVATIGPMKTIVPASLPSIQTGDSR